MAKQKKLLIVTSHGAFQPHDHHTIKKCLYHNKITAKKKDVSSLDFQSLQQGNRWFKETVYFPAGEWFFILYQIAD